MSYKTMLIILLCMSAPLMADEAQAVETPKAAAPTLSPEDQAKVAEEMKKDTVLRALVDELDRNTRQLELEDLARPYYIEYTVTDTETASVSTEMRALYQEDQDRSRRLTVGLRVGSYELDNTNFRRGLFSGGASLPIEDDYTALRQSVWWATDRAYKREAENFEEKKAFMKTKNIEDKPNDFIQTVPVVHFEKPAPLKADLEKMKNLALTISQLFRSFGLVQDSGIGLSTTRVNRYIINSEGTRIRTTSEVCSLRLYAEVQCEDGMMLSDSLSYDVKSFKDLPSIQDISKDCNEMVQQLSELRDAPKLDSYTGPVLFDAKASKSLFWGWMGQRFGGGQRPVGSGTSPDDFSKKIGTRILPRYMNVTDDPSKTSLDDTPLFGHYEYDHQGVKAKTIDLVKKGKLHTLLMSRNPSKEFKESTGHGRFGVTQGIPSCLFVESTSPASDEELREELLELAADEGLDYAIRIESVGSGGDTIAWKITKDGPDELVRGIQISGLNLKAFKRMPSIGDKPDVLNIGRGDTWVSVVAPAMLFEELDLAKIDRDFDKPPIIPHPLMR